MKTAIKVRKKQKNGKFNRYFHRMKMKMKMRVGRLKMSLKNGIALVFKQPKCAKQADQIQCLNR